MKNETKIMICLALLFSMVLFGCSKKPITKYIMQTKIDSVLIKEIERVEILTKDTVITTQYDSVTITDTLDCPNVPTKYIERYSKAGKTKASYSVNKGVLTFKCEADSLKIVVTNLRSILYKTQNDLIKKNIENKTTVIEKPIEKIKYKVPKWCYLLIVYFIASLFYFWRKPITKLLKYYL